MADDGGLTALHHASKQGDIRTLQAAIKSNDVNAGDSDNMTPLHYAAWYGFPACVQALIAGGAALNKFDHDGATALHAAAYNGQLTCVVALIEAGASATITDNENLLARQSAAEQGHKEIVTYLKAIEEDQKADRALEEAEKQFNEAKEASKVAKAAAAKAIKDTKKRISALEKERKKTAKTLKLKKAKMKSRTPMSFSEMQQHHPTPLAEPPTKSKRRQSGSSLNGDLPPTPRSLSKSTSASNIKAGKVDMALAQIEADRDEYETLEVFLNSLGIGEYSRVFKEEKVTIDKLRGCGLADLKGLGLPGGIAKKILSALS